MTGSGRAWRDTLRPPEPRALRRDVVAGVTVAAYLVPQVLAYAGLARVPPAAGLWAAFAALAVYFLLGSSPQALGGAGVDDGPDDRRCPDRDRGAG